MRLKPIDQQVVVLIGATSGIGRSAALRFAEHGARVVVAGRSMPALEALVHEIVAKGGQALAVPVDVAHFEQVKSVADQAIHTYGRIDSWVHLAAITMYAPFADTTADEFKRIVDVNLLGQVHGAMVALPHLRREGRGALIHISSIVARRSVPLQSAYAASKHGIIGFLDALRLELQHEGLPISVTNVMPGSINTPLFEKALTRLGVLPRPLPPVYEPELVAETILYVAEHPVREIYVGGAGKQFGLVQRLSPRLGDKLLAKIAFPAQKTDQRKPADSPHNLFEHLQGYDRVKGAFSSEAKPFSLYSLLKTRPAIRWAASASLLATGAFFATRMIYPRRKKSIWRTGLLASASNRLGRKKPAWRKIGRLAAGWSALKSLRS